MHTHARQALRREARALVRLLAPFEGKKPAELREAQEEAGRSAGAHKLRRALGAIQDAGYDVGAA